MTHASLEPGPVKTSPVATYNILGTRVAITSPQHICEVIESWAGDGITRSVAFPDAHAIVKGHDDPRMRAALDDADVVCPDGHPVAFVGRWLRGVPARRTCGPETVLNLCARSPKSGLRHYFYGAGPGVAETMANYLKERSPGLQVVGVESPPMRPLTPEEDDEMVARVMATKPDVVWIGLGAPKQEIWMMEHKAKLPGVTLMAVGAAFDFHAGRVKRAPAWMQQTGLEWLYRAASEPKRLGSRYAKIVPRFIQLTVAEALTTQRTAA